MQKKDTVPTSTPCGNRLYNVSPMPMGRIQIEHPDQHHNKFNLVIGHKNGAMSLWLIFLPLNIKRVKAVGM